jgi:hypothetical protein
VIKSAFKPHHIESSVDFFNHLQQVICLAPGMRLVYRTNFAGMYNDISQVVYFHHPKFTKQSQLKLKDILQNSINTLPLVTQLFPQLLVHYDDDSFIPFLSANANAFHDQATTDEADCIDDFVKRRIDEENEAAMMLKQKRRAESLKRETNEKDTSKHDGEHQYSWLVCCSSVFLIDAARNKILSSYNASLIPLIAYMMSDDKCTIGATLRQGFEESSMDPHTLLLNKAVKMDLGTAHGHVCLL